MQKGAPEDAPFYSGRFLTNHAYNFSINSGTAVNKSATNP